MLPWLLKALLNGRPMEREAYAFHDRVVHESVYYWRDCFGNRWLATSRWGWFRVPATLRYADRQTIQGKG